jgi:hypothetical protein
MVGYVGAKEMSESRTIPKAHRNKVRLILPLAVVELGVPLKTPYPMSVSLNFIWFCAFARQQI